MKDQDNKAYIKWGLTIFFTAAAVILFYYFIFHISQVVALFKSFLQIIAPILTGIVMAYLITPIINFLEKKIYGTFFKNKTITPKVKKRVRVVTIIISILLILFLIYEFFAMIIPELRSSIENISAQLGTYISNFEAWINKVLSNRASFNGVINGVIDDLIAEFNEWIDGSLTETLKGFLPQVNDLLKTLTTGVVSIFKILWNAAIGLIISVYLMFSKENFAGQAKKIVYAVAKKDTANCFIHNMRFINKTFLGFLVGKIVDSIIIGLLCFILTTIIGTPYPILISVVIGVTNIIPFFGPYIGAIPCAFLVLMVNPLECLYFVIMIFLLQQFDGNILGPKILGDSTGISGFWVIFSITLFGGLFGFLGMIIGVPLFAVIYSALKAWIRSNLDDKQMSKHTEDYIKVDYVDENNQFMQIPPEEVQEIVTGKRYGRKKLQYKIEPMEEEVDVNHVDLNHIEVNHADYGDVKKIKSNDQGENMQEKNDKKDKKETDQ